MSAGVLNSNCYVKIQVSVCGFVLDDETHFLPSSTTVSQIVEKAMDAAKREKFAWGFDAKIIVWDAMTLKLLDREKKLFECYAEGGCATIHVHINDLATRKIEAH